MMVAKYECQGQSKCTLHAKNSAFGDPCVGTFKYLEVGHNLYFQKITLNVFFFFALAQFFFFYVVATLKSVTQERSHKTNSN